MPLPVSHALYSHMLTCASSRAHTQQRRIRIQNARAYGISPHDLANAHLENIKQRILRSGGEIMEKSKSEVVAEEEKEAKDHIGHERCLNVVSERCMQHVRLKAVLSRCFAEASSFSTEAVIEEVKERSDVQSFVTCQVEKLQRKLDRQERLRMRPFHIDQVFPLYLLV